MRTCLFLLITILLLPLVPIAAAAQVCGNDVLEQPEACDDGNTASGDCCSASCQYEMQASACADDGNACTTDLCDAAGGCAHAAGNAGATCRAAESYGCGLRKVPAGALSMPVAISKFWFSGRTAACGPGSTIRLYPSSAQESSNGSCAAWHTYEQSPPTVSQLRTVLSGLRAGTFVPPVVEANVTSLNFAGGTISTAFNDMKLLYDARKDASGMWSFQVPVYDSTDCSQPAGAIRIVAFATARITSVSASNATIDANVDCQIVSVGDAGGDDYGTHVAPCANCRVPELCDGISESCPANAHAPAGTACTSDGRHCTADVCGGDGYCTHAAGNAGAICRTATAACDAAEHCSGSGVSCPADSLSTSAAVCRAAAGGCDVEERCSGSSSACPADSLASFGATCRAAASVCDVQESCGGSSAECPPDAFAASTIECRAGTGLCDPGETCTGSTGSCPADAFAAAVAVCRPSNGQCDVTERCTGVSGACPPNGFATASTSCASDDNPCTDDHCDGLGSCAHAATNDPCDNGLFCDGVDTCAGGGCSLHAGSPCRGADGDANCSESCDETADQCNAADPDGSACDDGNPATSDRCLGGMCTGTFPGACGDADAYCPEDCSIELDGDCTSCRTRALYLNDCEVRPKRRRTVEGTDRLMMRCTVDACGAEGGIAPASEGLTLTLADTSGVCFTDTLDAVECAQLAAGYRCRPAASGDPGIRILKLKAIDTCEYSLNLKLTGSDLTCLDSSRSPWIPTLIVGDDCGDVACPVGDRVLCPGTCGNGRASDPGEQCDGADDAACPGRCETTCSCR